MVPKSEFRFSNQSRDFQIQNEGFQIQKRGFQCQKQTLGPRSTLGPGLTLGPGQLWTCGPALSPGPTWAHLDSFGPIGSHSVYIYILLYNFLLLFFNVKGVLSAYVKGVLRVSTYLSIYMYVKIYLSKFVFESFSRSSP